MELVKQNTIASSVNFFEVLPMEDNPMFSLAKVRILYTGQNRNNSYISKDAVLKALPTLAGTPIIGEYIESTDNFGGHGGHVVIKDNEVTVVDTTSAYGFVSESSNFVWETVVENDGQTKEYLVADKVILWTGRYPQLNTLLEEGYYNQSMEIEVTEGDFSKIEGQDTFDIKNFIFTGLCILGVDKGNPNEHVEPCFESASIITYGLNNGTLKQQLKEMMEELKFSKKEEGGTSVANKNQNKDTAIEFELTHQQLSAKLRKKLEESRFTDSNGYNGRKYWYQDHTNERVVFEDLEEGGQLYSAPYKVVGDNVEINMAERKKSKVEFVPETGTEKMSLEDKIKSAEFKTVEITEVENKEKIRTEVEIDENGNPLEDSVKTSKESSQESTTKTIEVSDEEKARFENLNKNLKELQAKAGEYLVQIEEFSKKETAQAEIIQAQSVELAELRKFKRDSEIAGIMEKFENQLEKDILETIITKHENATVEVLESLIFAEIGKQNFSLGKYIKEQSVSIAMSAQEKEDHGQYSALIAKHLNQ